MRERERERERENVEIKRKAKNLKEKAEEAACSETAINLVQTHFAPNFFTKYAPVTSCYVEESMFKNVQSDKRMSSNEDNSEKLGAALFHLYK